jgi:mannose-1-phosphate guanylyltransferase
MNGRDNAWFAIMAGGIGSRFWPASRPDRPKQLLSFGPGTRTLLRETVDRAAIIAGPDRTFVITSNSLQDAITRHIDLLPRRNILAEPMKRNTLGAVLFATAAVLAANEEDADPVLGILPADHYIGGRAAFTDDISRAIRTARETDALVTIGIRPTRPDEGYGYIETAGRGGRILDVVSFREKPDARTAQKFLRSGRFLWNSGMFFWRVGAFMKQLQQASPDVALIAQDLIEATRKGDSQEQLEAFMALPDTSIDYELMERAASVKVITATFEWDDLGSWDALSRVSEADADGNVVLGAVVVSDCRRCIVYNELPHPIAAMGLEDMVVAVGREGILVTPIHRAQGVRELSQDARANGLSAAAGAGS